MAHYLFRWLCLPAFLQLFCYCIPTKQFKKANFHLSNDKIKVKAHPFYVSVIEINHNAKEATAEISIRIFTEDLEATLRRAGNNKLDLTKPTDKALANKVLSAYLQQKLQLQFDGKPATFQLLGFEQQLESTWCYLEVKQIPSFHSVTGKCSLLYDYQEKQINIFHVKNKGVEKSNKLEFPATNFSFSF